MAPMPLMAVIVKITPQTKQAKKTSSVMGAMPGLPITAGSKMMTPLGLPMKAPQMSPTMPAILANHPSVSSAMTTIGMTMPLLP